MPRPSILARAATLAALLAFAAISPAEEIPAPPVLGLANARVVPNASLASYRKVMIEPVTFAFPDEAKYATTGTEDRRELAGSLKQAFVDALGEVWPIVARPEPDVLRLRMTITEAVPNRVELGMLMAVVPGGLLAYATLPEEFNNIGAAGIEIELADALSGKRLASGFERRPGERIEFVEGMERWGHVKKAFQVWAAGLRQWLDKARR